MSFYEYITLVKINCWTFLLLQLTVFNLECSKIVRVLSKNVYRKAKIETPAFVVVYVRIKCNKVYLCFILK